MNKLHTSEVYIIARYYCRGRYQLFNNNITAGKHNAYYIIFDTCGNDSYYI